MALRVRLMYAASITALALSGCTSPASEPALDDASAMEVRDDLRDVFDEADVTGTFVLYDTDADDMVVVGAERAEQRMVPASTFKIAHSLIALETSAVDDVDEVIAYDGGDTRFPDEWEQDMSMREALPESNLLIYQIIASRIGLDRMQEHVELLGYGNAEIGDVVDEFWLTGPLKISAVEQARFLSRLATGDLPIAEENQEQVREISFVEERDGCRLHAKTGWAFDLDPERGWWVGWVVCDIESGSPDRVADPSQVHAFALNLDVEENGQVALRETIGHELLDRLGVLATQS